MSDFWTRRRAAVEAEDQADAAQIAAREEAARSAEQDEKTDAELLEEFSLPDPDTLKEGDDVTAFMAREVPERLRRRALRQLWRLNPVLANVDGLVDYGEDFTDAATVIEGMQTAYQVGKGMQAHVEALAAQAEPQQDPDDEAAEDTPSEVMAETDETQDQPAHDHIATARPTGAWPPAQTDDAEDTPACDIVTRPPRMQFHYE